MPSRESLSHNPILLLLTIIILYHSKINTYQDVCTIIIEFNGYIHPQARQFLQDLDK